MYFLVLKIDFYNLYYEDLYGQDIPKERQIEIINNPDVLNAFAIPGGYIYLYTGLLLYLDSEAALAGVIAHEIAHVEERHSTQRLTKYYGISILLGIALGENPSTIAEIATNA